MCVSMSVCFSVCVCVSLSLSLFFILSVLLSFVLFVLSFVFVFPSFLLFSKNSLSLSLSLSLLAVLFYPRETSLSLTSQGHFKDLHRLPPKGPQSVMAGAGGPGPSSWLPPVPSGLWFQKPRIWHYLATCTVFFGFFTAQKMDYVDPLGAKTCTI